MDLMHRDKLDTINIVLLSFDCVVENRSHKICPVSIFVTSRR